MSIDAVLDAPPAEPLVAWAVRSLEDRYPGSTWAASGGAVQCRKSRVIPFAEKGGSGRAGLKIYRDSLAAERQAAGLRHAAAMNHAAGHGAPVLYDHDADAAALLVEWVAAPQLEWALIAAAANPQGYRRTLMRVGEWLRHFHALGGVASGAFDGARYANRLAERLSTGGSDLHALEADPLWRRSVAWLHAALERLDGVSVPLALTHGDFTFTNVLVSPERVIGIDIWADKRLPLAEDLARMFVYLAMGDVFPLRARVMPVPLGERRSQQALLAGYGGLDPASTAAWETLVCFEALTRWLALSERLAVRTSIPEHWKRSGVRGVLTSIVGRG